MSPQVKRNLYILIMTHLLDHVNDNDSYYLLNVVSGLIYDCV